MLNWLLPWSVLRSCLLPDGIISSIQREAALSTWLSSPVLRPAVRFPGPPFVRAVERAMGGFRCVAGSEIGWILRCTRAASSCARTPLLRAVSDVVVRRTGFPTALAARGSGAGVARPEILAAPPIGPHHPPLSRTASLLERISGSHHR